MKGTTSPTSELGALDFDLDAALMAGPWLLLDPKFMGALHSELEEQLGREEAASTLVQVGFVHGLRDATRIVETGLASPDSELPIPSPLAIRFRMATKIEPPGAIEVSGTWPERTEAAARVSQLGAGPRLCCHLSAGYTSGWLSGIFGADMLALETSCSAGGDEACRFVAREAEVWRTRGDERADALLDSLPFEALRRAVEGHGFDGAAAPAEAGMDSEESVVQIWGPVMVIPFAGTDESLMAVELIARDPAAREVSVVILDLTGVIVDEAFGAAALEQIVDDIESWGAEAIFAGVSPLSEAVVAGLERQPLVVHKDLHGAIAAGFQIAESQRRVL